MQGFAVMKGQPIDVVPTGGGWLMEKKYDGWRALAGRPLDEVGAPWLETSTGNRITSLPYICDEVAELAPGDTILDGELIDPTSLVATESRGGGWNRVQHLASADTIHVPSPESPALRYVVFDVLVLLGEDVRGLPLTERRELLEQLFASRRNPCAVKLVAQWDADPDIAQRWLDEGYEGAVVKREDSLYVGGKRVGGWGKWKPQGTDDVIFTGTYPATAGSKYDGVAVGGFTFRRANGYEGRCAGMDDRLKEEFFDNPGLVAMTCGQVMELAHHGETVDGALRHPQFKRWRTDKAGEELDVQTPIKAGSRKARPRAVSTRPQRTQGRMRNYRQMGDEKLLGCLLDLEARTGDAYHRCVSGGSGDPDADLQVVRELVTSRNLHAHRVT